MTFKEKLVEFSAKNIWFPGEYWWGLIGFGFVVNSILFVISAVLKFLALVIGIVVFMLVNVVSLPAGRYVKWVPEDYSFDSHSTRLESWPRILGHNIWLWTAVPPAWVAHEYFHYSWITSILVGIICVPAIPIVWHIMTYKVTVTEKPEQ